MKQILQNSQTGEIAVEEVPAPRLLPGCALVRIAASVISAGTERASAEFAHKNLLHKAKSRPDLVREVISKIQRDGIFAAVQTVRSRLDQPQTPGYSSAGTILAVAQDVTDLKPGDRVSCAGTGFAVHAEIACVPRLLIARIPVRDSTEEQIPFDEAAFGTLGAVALHGIRTAEAKLGDMVAVIGLGLMGQLTVQVLKAAGCRVIGMDIDPWRAELAREMGADAVATSASELGDLCAASSQGMGVDSVLVTAETPSSEPVNLAGAIARDRGIVVAVGTVGIDIERKNYYEKELDFRVSRSYGPGRYDTAYEQKGRDYPIGYVRWTETRNMDAFLQLLAEGKLKLQPLITHRFPIDRAGDAYELIMGGPKRAFLGVSIQYGESAPHLQTLQLVPTAATSAPRTGSSTLSIGLLGAGTFASAILIPAIKASPHTSLVSVSSANGSHAHHAAQKFGFNTSTTDNAELIHQAQINTVVIATRHHLHAQQVLAALNAGKNVFCEKPLCLSEEELLSIVRAYLGLPSAASPLLMVGFNRRFAPMTTRMKTFLASISEPLALHYRINAGYLPRDHWLNDPTQGGGRILGEVCHFIDLTMFLAGSPIVEIEARAVGASSRYSGDNVLISVGLANRSEGTISYLANGDRSYSKERIEVFGGGSTAVLDDFRRLDLVRKGRRKTYHSRWSQDKGHRAEWAAFAQAVEHGGESPISFRDLIGSTLATLRAEQSRQEGKRLAVGASEFINAALRTSNPAPPRSE